MAYQYVMPNQQTQPIDYSQGQQQQQQGQGGGMSMLSDAMGGENPLSNLFGGGASTDPYGFGGSDPFSTSSYAGGGGEAIAGGTAATTGGSGSAASGAGAGSSYGGTAAGGWLAALAAVIIGNETNAAGGGYRKDGTEYATDVVTGQVLEQDLNQRWLPSIFGEDLQNDVTGLGSDTKIFGELQNFDFGNAWEAYKEGTSGKILDGIMGLFK